MTSSGSAAATIASSSNGSPKRSAPRLIRRAVRQTAAGNCTLGSCVRFCARLNGFSRLERSAFGFTHSRPAFLMYAAHSSGPPPLSAGESPNAPSPTLRGQPMRRPRRPPLRSTRKFRFSGCRVARRNRNENRQRGNSVTPGHDRRRGNQDRFPPGQRLPALTASQNRIGSAQGNVNEEDGLARRSHQRGQQGRLFSGSQNYARRITEPLGVTSLGAQ